jgi:hypothetical protein
MDIPPVPEISAQLVSDSANMYTDTRVQFRIDE